MIIVTERLILREMNTADYDAMYRLLADSDIKQHAPIHLTKKEFTDGLIRTSNGIEYSDSNYGQFAKRLERTYRRLRTYYVKYKRRN